jgi:hypothetical protein
MEATIQSINKVGETQVEVQVLFTGGLIKVLMFPIDTDRPAIRAAVKEELLRLKSIDAKVAALQPLVNVVIT